MHNNLFNRKLIRSVISVILVFLTAFMMLACGSVTGNMSSSSDRQNQTSTTGDPADQDSADPAEITISGQGVSHTGAMMQFIQNIHESFEGITGALWYYDPSDRLDYKSLSISSVAISGNTALIEGEGELNGSPDYSFTFTITDVSPDEVHIEIYDSAGSLHYESIFITIVPGDFSIELQ